MAAATTIDDLRITVGLDMSQLSADFLTADKTVKAGLGQINRELNNTKLQLRINTAGLDPKNDAAGILKEQEAALTKELSLQADKLRILEAEYQRLEQAEGKESYVAQRQYTGVLKQKAAVAELGAELKKVQAELAKPAPKVNLAKDLETQIAKMKQLQSNADLKFKIDTSGLDAVKKASEILKAEQVKLKVTVSAQKKTVALLTEEYNKLAAAEGKGSAAARQMEARVLQETATLKQYEQQLKTTSNAISPSKWSGRLAQQQAAIASHFQSIQASITNFTGSTNSAVMASLDIIQQVPTAWGKVAAGIAAAGAVAEVAAFRIADMARPAANTGHAMDKLAKQTGLSTSEIGKFKGLITMGGGDFDAGLRGLVRLRNNLREAGDAGNDTTAMLQKFGVSWRDASGNIRNNLDLLKEMKKGYDRAAAAGQEYEFVMQAFGARSAGAMAPLLADLDKAQEVMANLVKPGYLDLNLANEVWWDFKAMDTQLAQLKTSMTQALLPVAREVIPEYTEMFKEATKWVRDHKDAIKTTALAISKLAEAIVGVLGGAAKFAVTLMDVNKQLDGIVAKGGIAGAVIGGVVGGMAAGPVGVVAGATIGAGIGMGASTAIGENSDKYKAIQASRMADQQAAEAKAIAEEKKRAADAESQIMQQAADAERKAIDEKIKAEQEAVDANKRATAEILFNMQHSTGSLEDEYQKQIYQIRKWRDEQLSKSNGAKETASIIEQACAREAQAFQDAAKKAKSATDGLLDDIYRMQHSDYENSFHDMYKRATEAVRQGADLDVVNQWMQAKADKIHEDFRNREGEPMTYNASSDPAWQELLNTWGQRTQDFAQGAAIQKDAAGQLAQIPSGMEQAMQAGTEQQSQIMQEAASSIQNAIAPLLEAATTSLSAAQVMSNSADIMINAASMMNDSVERSQGHITNINQLNSDGGSNAINVPAAAQPQMDLSGLMQAATNVSAAAVAFADLDFTGLKESMTSFQSAAAKLQELDFTALQESGSMLQAAAEGFQYIDFGLMAEAHTGMKEAANELGNVSAELSRAAADLISASEAVKDAMSKPKEVKIDMGGISVAVNNPAFFSPEQIRVQTEQAISTGMNAAAQRIKSMSL